MHTGAFHNAQVVSSIPCMLIGCYPRSGCASVHICWPTHCHFCLLANASWATKPVSAVYYFLLCIRAVASLSPHSLRVGWVVWGLCLSLRPGLLCSCSLDRAVGILDDQGCVNVCVACLGMSIVVCVSLLEDVGQSGSRSGLLIVSIMVTGVALGIGLGEVLNLHFLKK